VMGGQEKQGVSQRILDPGSARCRS
jgi:hypothetical protein